MATRFLPKICQYSLASLGLLILSGGVPAPLHAAEFTWTGESEAGNGWTDSDNWSPGTGHPGADDTAHVDFSSTSGNVSVSNGSVGILNVGYGDLKNFSFGGGGSQSLTLQMTSGSARINKGGSRDVTFIRRVNFASDTVITVEGGRLIFERDGGNAVFQGNGNITFEGAGGVSVFAGNSTVFSTTFNGNTVVQNHGTLLINSTFHASTAAPA
ncbi:MAG TPA: hypothetical protein VNQ90_17975, partial [Chthoniobacteraceae bacterium]|nr:hypothetical protein [Chthoniobacteraceae bacterium]